MRENGAFGQNIDRVYDQAAIRRYYLADPETRYSVPTNNEKRVSLDGPY